MKSRKLLKNNGISNDEDRNKKCPVNILFFYPSFILSVLEKGT